MLNINLVSKFCNKFVEMKLNEILRKKCGLDINATLDDLILVEEDNAFRFCIQAKGTISKSSIIALANKN